MKHVMIDLETMGVGPRAPIVAIGAVEFDPYGQHEYDNEFMMTVDLATAIEHGAQVDGDTVMWWLRQNSLLQGMLCDHPQDLVDALVAFEQWYRSSKFDRMWCYGATFDAVILEQAYTSIGVAPPWSYRDVRDARTLIDVAGVDRVKPTIPHHPLQDAHAQVMEVQAAYKKLNLCIPISSP